MFARARALLYLNTIPERFGLVLVEANAAGVPVIAMDLGKGSCAGWCVATKRIREHQDRVITERLNEAKSLRACDRLKSTGRSCP